MTPSPKSNTPPKVQFNVYLPPDLVRRVKHRCIDEGDSLSGFVERVLDDYLSRTETEEETR